ncbi:unnamed protein product [Discosporangium mesarthrocarpum]
MKLPQTRKRNGHPPPASRCGCRRLFIAWVFLIVAVGDCLRDSEGAGVDNTESDANNAGYDTSYQVDTTDMIRAIEDLYRAEIKRQERINLEDAVAHDNGPKEISIFCPQAPQVKIVDLAQAARGNNECLVLHINAPELSSKLVLKCDGSDNREFGWGEDW